MASFAPSRMTGAPVVPCGQAGCGRRRVGAMITSLQQFKEGGKLVLVGPNGETRHGFFSFSGVGHYKVVDCILGAVFNTY